MAASASRFLVGPAYERAAGVVDAGELRRGRLAALVRLVRTGRPAPIFRSVSGDAAPEMGFEEMYARAGLDLRSIPWAALAPHPALLAWLDGVRAPGGQLALVVGCGLGDDAEAVSRYGYEVIAFDVAPTAIATCRRRFPDSRVDYRVADLFALPAVWSNKFDLVVEIRTLQSLPVDQRARAAGAIAATVSPGGLLWVRCLARGDGDAVTVRPWPVSRRELGAFGDAGLREVEFQEDEPAAGRARSFTVVYRSER